MNLGLTHGVALTWGALPNSLWWAVFSAIYTEVTLLHQVDVPLHLSTMATMDIIMLVQAGVALFCLLMLMVGDPGLLLPLDSIC